MTAMILRFWKWVFGENISLQEPQILALILAISALTFPYYRHKGD